MTLADLQCLAGIRTQGYGNSHRRATEGSNISVTAAEKARIQKECDIQPGTSEWFKLWFSLPFMTGEKPTGPTRHR
jgi:hypothetical protein